MEAHNRSLYDHFVLLNTKRDEIAPIIKETALDFVRNLTIWQTLALVSCLYWALTSFAAYRRVRVPGAPVHGYWTWFEPTWFMQLRYAFTAHNIISSGYLKVNSFQVWAIERRQNEREKAPLWTRKLK